MLDAHKKQDVAYTTRHVTVQDSFNFLQSKLTTLSIVCEKMLESTPWHETATYGVFLSIQDIQDHAKALAESVKMPQTEQ